MNVKGCDVSSIMEIELARLTTVLQAEIEARKYAVDPPKQTKEQKLAALQEKWSPAYHDYKAG